MKLTAKKLKQIIKEELNEMAYVTDIAGDDEDRAIDAHRRAKRARGEYPRRPNMPSEPDPRSDEEIVQARKEGMVAATRSIMKEFPGGLMVDQNTYDAIQELAPELLDRVRVTPPRRQPRRRE